MQRISVFDMLKIGVGPSSSHTMGPWRASLRFIREATQDHLLTDIVRLNVTLYGSLAKTGKGHGTDVAVLMGLAGADPVTCDVTRIDTGVAEIHATGRILLGGVHEIAFRPEEHLIWRYDASLPYHPNGMTFEANFRDGTTYRATYYSVGGGFVEREGETRITTDILLPYPCERADDLRAHCEREQMAIWQMVWANEQRWRPADEVHKQLLNIWHVMREGIYHGCHSEGTLPGGLGVQRRASHLHRQLMGKASYADIDTWQAQLQAGTYSFQQMVQWVSCFALAINEENASFGRVVTAPTNGAAGVLPAVLMYMVMAFGANDEAIVRFLLVAGEIGTFFKKRATISAAQGGCQAEIGVSSAMAAAALTEFHGGSVAQALMAAEIAMEHHLGLTCDPVGGLVQIPCIERNAMGAMKAITSANIALISTPEHARVSLDEVITTMWATARDMSDKYKETSEGGLAVNLSVNVIEC
jgi:L-serine dehydratase